MGSTRCLKTLPAQVLRLLQTHLWTKVKLHLLVRSLLLLAQSLLLRIPSRIVPEIKPVLDTITVVQPVMLALLTILKSLLAPQTRPITCQDSPEEVLPMRQVPARAVLDPLGNNQRILTRQRYPRYPASMARLPRGEIKTGQGRQTLHQANQGIRQSRALRMGRALSRVMGVAGS